MEDCKHMDFAANVRVARIEDVGKFVAEVTIQCSDCGLPFAFVGIPPGFTYQHPTVTLDGLEAHLPIAPRGVNPNPFQQMVSGKKRFDS